MNLELIKTPYDSHDNILFGFIKKSLVDGRIYDDSSIAFPYTKLKTKYKLRLSDINEPVNIYLNDFLYLEYSDSEQIFDFWILPSYKNVIKVADLNGNLKVEYRFNCYNIHIFLAEFSKQYKVLWNKLYQALANTFYDLNKVQNLDGENLIPEDRYTRAVAKLLGTERYENLTNSEYYNFLHNVFNMNLYAGTERGYYQIQQALSSYINRIDLIPIEKYIPFKNELYGKLFYDSTNKNKFKIYPSYINHNNEWNLINYSNEIPASTLLTGYVYVDGELNTSGDDTGALKIKYTEDTEFFKYENYTVDSFTNNDIYNDDEGYYTGFVDEKFIILRNPIIDGTVYINNTGSISISESSYLTNNDYNLVSLGTKYKDEITNIDATYRTQNTPLVLGKIEQDTTSARNIVKIYLSGHSDTDASYLDYKENNYGSVAVVIRASQIIDNKLKNIINNLVRDVLPIHIQYYLIFSTIDIWNNWGEIDFTFEERFGDGTSGGAFPLTVFGDLK
jgi:hypothetical protein